MTRIERVGEEASSAWNAFVARAPGASVYHLYEWRTVIATVFGHESHYFAARDQDDQICGVLPVVRLRSALFGDFMVSMPYFNYGGVVADDAAVRSTLIDAAAKYAREIGVSHLELRHDAPLHPDWPVRTDKVAMHLRLPESADALSKQLGSKLRSQIKRPAKEGAVCVEGGAELLDEFYGVFARNMRDLGTPVYSRTWFETILKTFPARTRLFVVRLRDVAVAAALVIGYRGRLEIPWASSLQEANALGVNMLLYWHVLRYACAQKYEIFDFGRSSVDAGTYRFKKQWGAEPHQLYWHYWIRGGGPPPMLNPANPKYRLAVAAWRRLPLAVANRLGPLLVKNLP
ncbi:MAG TPA: FemAB family XrtA/PEP-CTERM system-associated protein [Steroidobacter sp.]|nr:FemAB family XrtA/PEP-CTERM system-associated protein [Steroidobacter sp.]